MRDKKKREKITAGTEETNVSHHFKGLNEEISVSYVSGRQMSWNLLDGALTDFCFLPPYKRHFYGLY